MSNEKQLKTILAVDDDSLILMNTVEMLEELGYNVLEANSGETALTLAMEHLVDLVITDQSMPGMTGQELISRLRSDGRDVPIILATGYVEISGEPQDAVYLLSKPFTPKDLQNRISEALGTVGT